MVRQLLTVTLAVGAFATAQHRDTQGYSYETTESPLSVHDSIPDLKSSRRRHGNARDRILGTFKSLIDVLDLEKQADDVSRIMTNLYGETEKDLKESFPQVLKMTTEYFTNIANDQLSQTQQLLKNVDVMNIPGYKETNQAINSVLTDGIISDTIYPLQGRVDFSKARENFRQLSQEAYSRAQAALDSAKESGQEFKLKANQDMQERIPMDTEAWKSLIQEFAGPLPDRIQNYYVRLFQTVQEEATNSAEEIMDIATNSVVDVMGRTVNEAENFEQNTMDTMNEEVKNVGDKLVKITGNLFDIMNNTLTRQFNIKLGDRSVDKYKLQNLIVEKTRDWERKMIDSNFAKHFTVPSLGARNIGKPMFSAEYLDEWKKSYKANLDDVMQRTVADEREKLEKFFEQDFQAKLEEKRLHYEGKLKQYIERQKRLRLEQWEKEQEEIRELQERLKQENEDYYSY